MCATYFQEGRETKIEKMWDNYQAADKRILGACQQMFRALKTGEKIREKGEEKLCK